MTIISRAKSTTICCQCGGTIQQGRECVRRDGQQEATCLACHEENAEALSGAGGNFLILRSLRRTIRRWVW
jgi:hypothetical protein